MNAPTATRFGRLALSVACGLLGGLICLGALPSSAQELDTDYLPKSLTSGKAKATVRLPQSSQIDPQTQTAPNIQSGPAMRAPLTATVSKTLYLPPAMYGQWSVTGTLIETNVPDTYPVSNNIWILERQGERVYVSNPENGATASIDVKAAQGNTATFLKRDQLGRMTLSETVTITLDGDSFSGQNMKKLEYFRDGKLVKTQYALFHLNGTRISGARSRFKPETGDSGPDIQIEEVKR